MSDEFLIDGMLSGTGVRDAVDGGYLDPQAIGLSKQLAADLAAWQADYENAHYCGFPPGMIAELDQAGAALAARAAAELPNVNFSYYSNGLMRRLP